MSSAHVLVPLDPIALEGTPPEVARRLLGARLQVGDGTALVSFFVVDRKNPILGIHAAAFVGDAVQFVHQHIRAAALRF